MSVDHVHSCSVCVLDILITFGARLSDINDAFSVLPFQISYCVTLLGQFCAIPLRLELSVNKGLAMLPLSWMVKHPPWVDHSKPEDASFPHSDSDVTLTFKVYI